MKKVKLDALVSGILLPSAQLTKSLSEKLKNNETEGAGIALYLLVVNFSGRQWNS